MYRVYDSVNKTWVSKDKILISTFNNDIYMRKRGLFGTEKLELVSNEKFIVHESIGVLDKNNVLIYEGDICELKLEDGVAKCVVSYVPERAAYILFDNENMLYYEFVKGMSDSLTVIGNVFDNTDEINIENEKEEMEEEE